MAERRLYLPATPEDAYLITRDRFIPGDEPVIQLAARRGGLPGGTAVEVRVDDRSLVDQNNGLYLVERERISADAIGRAFQPWHVDVEPEIRQRWGNYMRPDMPITLRNLVGAETPGTLERLEAPRVEARLVELHARPVQPTLDMAHALELHRRIFQDVYPWAGEARTVNIGRPGGPAFQAWEYIETSWQLIEARLSERNHLAGLERAAFVDEVTEIYNAVNTTHTFREGNGRTQREWMDALASGAGYHLEWESVHGNVNDVASQRAREGDLTDLRKMMDSITTPSSSGPKHDEWTEEERMARDRASAGFTRSTAAGVGAAEASKTERKDAVPFTPKVAPGRSIEVDGLGYDD